ncbi:hypothetical protein HYH02_012560 [Chlamydomonas schloesseri]|uniref:Uncharacterized protein n=1 Tax=Chlamydomonas schloesseri TaxID=2026947 RepID=A0A835W2I2_9CHLO|nr:hypothetical protein HYH02_012560 [Chlamydomonas schloesseri]|eukprot:KAG2433631.1 hypothetical protein HYH02_012560 [Chlamydomonas schloesseri]
MILTPCVLALATAARCLVWRPRRPSWVTRLVAALEALAALLAAALETNVLVVVYLLMPLALAQVDAFDGSGDHDVKVYLTSVVAAWVAALGLAAVLAATAWMLLTLYLHEVIYYKAYAPQYAAPEQALLAPDALATGVFGTAAGGPDGRPEPAGAEPDPEAATPNSYPSSSYYYPKQYQYQYSDTAAAAVAMAGKQQAAAGVPFPSLLHAAAPATPPPPAPEGAAYLAAGTGERELPGGGAAAGGEVAVAPRMHTAARPPPQLQPL